MNNKILKTTTNSREYALKVREINSVDDKRNMCYVSTRNKKDNKCWKSYRKTQYR